jgi:hypothetical protein
MDRDSWWRQFQLILRPEMRSEMCFSV